MFQAGEKRQSLSIVERSSVDLEAVRFWQGGENAENEKEARSISDREMSRVLFKKKAHNLPATRGTWLEMGNVELDFFINNIAEN